MSVISEQCVCCILLCSSFVSLWNTFSQNSLKLYAVLFYKTYKSTQKEVLISEGLRIHFTLLLCFQVLDFTGSLDLKLILAIVRKRKPWVLLALQLFCSCHSMKLMQVCMNCTPKLLPPSRMVLWSSTENPSWIQMRRFCCPLLSQRKGFESASLSR